MDQSGCEEVRVGLAPLGETLLIGMDSTSITLKWLGSSPKKSLPFGSALSRRNLFKKLESKVLRCTPISLRLINFTDPRILVVSVLCIFSRD